MHNAQLNIIYTIAYVYKIINRMVIMNYELCIVNYSNSFLI